jgi:hypothetical protein
MRVTLSFTCTLLRTYCQRYLFNSPKWQYIDQHPPSRPVPSRPFEATDSN